MEGKDHRVPLHFIFFFFLIFAWLILVTAHPAPGLLNGGESPGVGEPLPGPGTLEPPATQQPR